MSSRSLSTNSRALGNFSDIGVPVSRGLLLGSNIGLTLKLLFKLVVGELNEKKISSK